MARTAARKLSEKAARLKRVGGRRKRAKFTVSGHKSRYSGKELERKLETAIEFGASIRAMPGRVIVIDGEQTNVATVLINTYNLDPKEIVSPNINPIVVKRSAKLGVMSMESMFGHVVLDHKLCAAYYDACCSVIGSGSGSAIKTFPMEDLDKILQSAAIYTDPSIDGEFTLYITLCLHWGSKTAKWRKHLKLPRSASYEAENQFTRDEIIKHIVRHGYSYKCLGSVRSVRSIRPTMTYKFLLTKTGPGDPRIVQTYCRRFDHPDIILGYDFNPKPADL